MTYKVGDRVIINTRQYGLHNYYGSVRTITYISDGRLLFSANGLDGWVVDIEDVMPVTPLLEALE